MPVGREVKRTLSGAEQWTCEDNPDPLHSSCDQPEEPWEEPLSPEDAIAKVVAATRVG